MLRFKTIWAVLEYAFGSESSVCLSKIWALRGGGANLAPTSAERLTGPEAAGGDRGMIQRALIGISPQAIALVAAKLGTGSPDCELRYHCATLLVPYAWAYVYGEPGNLLIQLCVQSALSWWLDDKGVRSPGYRVITEATGAPEAYVRDAQHAIRAGLSRMIVQMEADLHVRLAAWLAQSESVELHS